MHFLTNTQNKCEIFILIPFNNNQFDLAHLVEHLVVMNTKGFLNNIMELGIIFDAMTFNDRITFSLSCDAQWTELALLNILSLFKGFRVNDEDIEKELHIINEERILRLKKNNFIKDIYSNIIEYFECKAYKACKAKAKAYTCNDVMAFYDMFMQNMFILVNVPKNMVPKCRNAFFALHAKQKHAKQRHAKHNHLKKNIYLLDYTGEYYLGVQLFPHGHKFQPFVDLLIYALFSKYDSMMIRYLRFSLGLTYSINTYYTTTGILIIGFSSNRDNNSDIPHLFFKFLSSFLKGSKEDWQKYVRGYCRQVQYLYSNNPKCETTLYGLNMFYNSSYGYSYTEYLSCIKKQDSLKICQHIVRSILNSPKVMTFKM